jgi:hypothetical protein
MVGLVIRTSLNCATMALRMKVFELDGILMPRHASRAEASKLGRSKQGFRPESLLSLSSPPSHTGLTIQYL